MPGPNSTSRPIDKIKQYLTDGDYERAAYEYVDLSFGASVAGADADLKDQLAEFAEYITDYDAAGLTVKDRMPKAGAEAVSGFMDALSEVRDKLLVVSGGKALDHEKRIWGKKLQGSELVLGNIAAVQDLASNMEAADPVFKKASAAAGMLSVLRDVFEETPLSDTICKKYELAAGTTMGQFAADADGSVKKYHITHDADMNAARFRERGNAILQNGSIKADGSHLRTTYGLEVKDHRVQVVRDANGDTKAYELLGRSNESALNSIDAYSEEIAKTVKVASDHLRTLQEMAVKKNSNSRYFNDMLHALEDVTHLGPHCSPDLVQETLKHLKEVSEEYVKKTDRSFFRGRSDDGKARREKAGKLVEFADMEYKRLPSCVDRSVNPTLSLDLQKGDLKKNREVIDAALAAELSAKAPKEAPKTEAAAQASAPAAQAPAPAAAEAEPVAAPAPADPKRRSLNIATLISEQKLEEPAINRGISPERKIAVHPKIVAEYQKKQAEAASKKAAGPAPM